MGELYDRLTDLNNLYEAFLKCIKGVDWKESVQRYEANALANLYALQQSLRNGSYRQKPFFEFDISERGKNRHIKALHISDRVLQRSLCDYVLNPVLLGYTVYDNGASVRGKGIEFARKRLKVHLQRYYREHGNRGYVLKIDFSKYFDSIPHDILMQKLSEKIADDRVVSLVGYLVSCFGGSRGVGIGSQLSQTVGIFYPSPLDNYCKVVRGCRYYGRYMDDTYIIHHDKAFLRSLLDAYSSIAASLGIVLNEKKTQILKLEHSFTFLKMRYTVSESGHIRVTPARESFVRERRKLRKFTRMSARRRISRKRIEEQYKSWRGNIARYHCYRGVQVTDAIYTLLFGGIHGRRAGSH